MSLRRRVLKHKPEIPSAKGGGGLTREAGSMVLLGLVKDSIKLLMASYLEFASL